MDPGRRGHGDRCPGCAGAGRDIDPPHVSRGRAGGHGPARRAGDGGPCAAGGARPGRRGALAPRHRKRCRRGGRLARRCARDPIESRHRRRARAAHAASDRLHARAQVHLARRGGGRPGPDRAHRRHRAPRVPHRRPADCRIRLAWLSRRVHRSRLRGGRALLAPRLEEQPARYGRWRLPSRVHGRIDCDAWLRAAVLPLHGGAASAARRAPRRLRLRPALRRGVLCVPPRHDRGGGRRRAFRPAVPRARRGARRPVVRSGGRRPSMSAGSLPRGPATPDAANGPPATAAASRLELLAGATLARLHGAGGGDPAGGRVLDAVGRELWRAASEGHACIDVDGDDADALAASPVVDVVPAVAAGVPAGGFVASRPLVLDAGKLYPQRFWAAETRLAAGLLRHAQLAPLVDPARIVAALDQAFGPDSATEPDMQRRAVELGLTRRLLLLSGGPGTGKSTTLARLIDIARRLAPALRIAVAAPTGKAAARAMQAMQAMAATSGPEAGVGEGGAPVRGGLTLHR